jgi:hypothetical protein
LTAVQPKPGTAKELPSEVGAKLSAYGERSKYETAKRLVPELKRPEIGSSTTLWPIPRYHHADAAALRTTSAGVHRLIRLHTRC